MVLPAELLQSYVPGLLASRFPARPTPLGAPGVERFSAAVVFADISGFTPLAERLAMRGPAGAEALTDLLNAYFAKLTGLIAEHGGEVITFAGDGLLAVWPATDSEEALATATRDAGRCALAVQSALGSYQTIDGLRLLLRIGVGAGEVMALHVGGSVGAGGSCWPAPRWLKAAWPSSRQHGVRWSSPPTPGSWSMTAVPASGWPKAACG